MYACDADEDTFALLFKSMDSRRRLAAALRAAEALFVADLLMVDWMQCKQGKRQGKSG